MERTPKVIYFVKLPLFRHPFGHSVSFSVVKVRQSFFLHFGFFFGGCLDQNFYFRIDTPKQMLLLTSIINGKMFLSNHSPNNLALFSHYNCKKFFCSTQIKTSLVSAILLLNTILFLTKMPLLYIGPKILFFQLVSQGIKVFVQWQKQITN